MDIEEFPQMFDTDDYFKCIQKKQVFCMIVARLGLGSNESSTWNKIMRNKDVEWKLDRTYIQRGFCLPPGKESKTDFARQTTNFINKQISVHNLTVTDIDMLHCQDEIPPMSILNMAFLLFLITIICLVVMGTLMDTKSKRLKSLLGEIIVKFSIKENWKKITNPPKNGDFNKLKSIQGIRMFTMFCIIMLHACLNLGMMYYSNPELLEYVVQFLASDMTGIFFIFLVHVFLMISTFLLTNQVHNHYEKYGKFTLNDIVVLVTNRYLRLYLPALAFVFFSHTSIMEPYLGVPTMKLYKINQAACQKSWINTLTFSNNFNNSEQDMCYAPTWYISADFQGYLFATFIIYLILKYKLNSMKVMVMLLINSVLIFGLVIYFNDMEHIVTKLSLKVLQLNFVMYIPEFNMMYSPTHSTLPTSITGMIFGYLYYKSKKYEIGNKRWLYHAAWNIFFYGLPLLSIYLSSLKYSRFITAVLGSMVKVIFTSGIAIGIIGMSQGLGGYTKTVLEGKYCLTFGNIAFSTYLFNYLVMIFFNIGKSELQELNISFALNTLLVETIASILGGFVISLTIEQPALALQKKFLPQLDKNYVMSNKIK